jgi:hypothetical protein
VQYCGPRTAKRRRVRCWRNETEEAMQNNKNVHPADSLLFLLLFLCSLFCLVFLAKCIVVSLIERGEWKLALLQPNVFRVYHPLDGGKLACLLCLSLDTDYQEVYTGRGEKCTMTRDAASKNTRASRDHGRSKKRS